MKSFVFLWVLMLNSVSQAQCLDISGIYPNCKASSIYSETVTLVASQKVEQGHTVYLFEFTDNGQEMSTTIITDAQARPVVVEGLKEPPPVELTYKATCSPSDIVVSAKPKSLGGSTTGKLRITRDADGTLRMTDQTIVFGQVTQERHYSCKAQY